MLADNQKATIKQIIQTISGGAELTHRECGEVSPVIFCFSDDPTKQGAAIGLSSGEEAKHFIAHAPKVIKQLANKQLVNAAIQADYYCLMSEAWTTLCKEGEDLIAPSGSPERKECVSFSIFNKDGVPLGMAISVILAKGKFAKTYFKFADVENPMVTSADLNLDNKTVH